MINGLRALMVSTKLCGENGFKGRGDERVEACGNAEESGKAEEFGRAEEFGKAEEFGNAGPKQETTHPVS